MSRDAADDAAWLDGFGACLVLVPHPDDESIGCGGLIALLRQRGRDVRVVLVSDGTMSHPNSRSHDAPARRALRLGELRTALAVLGVAPDALHTLDLPDGALPGPGEPAFERAVEALASLARDLHAPTVLAPWRRDPHPDHRAVAAMADALAARGAVARIVAYAVWLDERGAPDAWPDDGEARVRRLDIRAVVDLKCEAVAAHASQLGGVIRDDAAGFTLPRSMLARCAVPDELYLECP